MNSLQRTCCTCTLVNQQLISIFDYVDNELKVCDMLTALAPQLLVLSSVKLPKQLCASCIELLKSSYKFIQKCKESEHQLLIALETYEASLDAENCTTIVSSTDKAASKDLKDEPISEEKDSGNKYRNCVKIEVGEVELKDSDIMQRMKSSQACSDVVIGGHEDNGNALNKNDKKTSEVKNQHIGNNEERPSTQLNSSSVENDSENSYLKWLSKAYYCCPGCDMEFYTFPNLKRHAAAHDDHSRFYECILCTCRFATPNALASHKMSHTKEYMPRTRPPGGYKCEGCPQQFEKITSLLEHTQALHKIDAFLSFKCDLCPMKFRKGSEFDKHLQAHPEYQKFKCTICEGTFLNEDHFNVHMDAHKALKPYICNLCNTGFKTKKEHSNHQRYHAVRKPHPCSICGKSLSTPGTFARHMERHSGEKIFQCVDCPVKFKSRTDITRHSRLHRSEKP